MAALPGRTTFVLILLTARTQLRPLFFGAAAAFAAQAVISVALGNLLSFLPPWFVQIATGLLFLYFANSFRRDAQADTLDNSLPQNMPHPFRTVFMIIFAAEWGDVSQVAIASFSADHHEPWTVLLSAIVALWAITLLAIGVGVRLNRIVNPRKIQNWAAIFFAGVGLLLVIRGCSWLLF